MNHKKFKTQLKRDHIEGLFNSINALLQREVDNDDEKLLFAVLAQVNGRLYDKLGTWQKEYKISFSPAESFALRILAIDYFAGRHTEYLGNKLHLIAAEIHKHYT